MIPFVKYMYCIVIGTTDNHFTNSCGGFQMVEKLSGHRSLLTGSEIDCVFGNAIETKHAFMACSVDGHRRN
jgi:hypothetical protein